MASGALRPFLAGGAAMLAGVLVGVLVGALAWRSSPARPGEAAAPERTREAALRALADAEVRTIEELAARLALVEQRLDELERRPASALAAPPAAGPARRDLLLGGLGELGEPADALGDRATDRVRALQEIALDPRRSAADRSAAVGRLWRLDLESGRTGSRTPEVVDGLLALAAVEPDAELRREMVFHVLDATEPRHVRGLLDLLELDPDAGVRAQAADTLQAHSSLPEVRAALERASTGDASERVRETAAEMLARADEGG